MPISTRSERAALLTALTLGAATLLTGAIHFVDWANYKMKGKLR